jgi:hypothetical protein
MNGVPGFQSEGSDLDVELVPASPNHMIDAAHHTRGCFQRAPRRILERLARCENWLLSHHTWTFDFFDVLQGIGDNPVPAEKLNGLGTLIRNTDGVLEYPRVLSLKRVLG